MKYILLYIFLGFVFSNCSKENNLTPEQQLIEDIKIIEQYLKDNNLSAQKTATGLHYIILNSGSGDSPTLTSSVKIKYKGYFTSKEDFDGTIGNEVTIFNLSENLISGFKESLQLLKRGGKGTFLIPSYIGYGNQDYNSIPANSVLIFDIELVDF